MTLQLSDNHNISIDQKLFPIVPVGIITPLGYLILYHSGSYAIIEGEDE